METLSAPAEPPARLDRGWLSGPRFALVLGLLVFAAFPLVSLGLRTFVFRDFGLFSYPVAFFARESFWRGELPLWNPLNHCGVPFLAQWNTMVLYPPTLLYLVLPLGWSLSFFCVLHLFWGGLGMYFLARQWTGFRLAGGLAGILFAFNGLSLSFLMWPSHIATFSWVPWVLRLGPEGWRGGGRKLALAIGAAALQMLAGAPETILVTWVLLGLLAVGELFCDRQSSSSAAMAGNLGPLAVSKWKMVLRLFGMGLVVALICAAQLLPFLVLLGHSQRDSAYASSTHDWSMPVWGWANFLVPLFRTNPTAQGVYLQNLQYWTSSYYVGIGAVWLAIIGVWRAREWRVRLLAVVCFLALVLAWGNTSVLFTVLQRCFPGLGFVRYPVKFVIVAVAVAPILAAYGLTALVCTLRRMTTFEWVSGLVLLGLVGLIVACERNAGSDIWHTTLRSGISRAGFLMLEFLLVAFLVYLVKTPNPVKFRPLPGALLLGAFCLDLLTHVPNQNPTVPPAVYSPGWASDRLALKPKPNPGEFRAMVSPAARQYLSQNSLANPAENHLRNRLAIRANANLLDRIPEVDGFFSLVPREAWELTTLPYAHPGESYNSLLDFLGVAQVTRPGTWTEWSPRGSALPMITAGQTPQFENERVAREAFMQTNVDFGQVVYLPAAARTEVTATRQPETKVHVTRYTSERLELQTEAPKASMVVLSQTWYPGWQAAIDGQPAKLWRANYAFQALEVPKGKHTVEVRYRDRAFWSGAMLSGLGLLLWAGCLLRGRRSA